MNPSVFAAAVATILGVVGVSTVDQSTVRSVIVAGATIVLGLEAAFRYLAKKSSNDAAVKAKQAQQGIAEAAARSAEANLKGLSYANVPPVAPAAELPPAVEKPVHPPTAAVPPQVPGPRA